MDNLIDRTYFLSGTTFIPGLEVSNGFDQSINSNIIQELNELIAQKQKKFFIYILGKDLYDEFISDSDNEKWSEMLDMLIDSDAKVSPLANYVYFNYLANKAATLANSGVVKTKSDNMIMSSPVTLQVIAWNEMCDMMDEFFEWLYDNRSALEDENELSSCYWYKLTKRKNTFGL